jgi:adenylosuccinate lyase
MIAFIETVQASLETAGYGHLKGEFHKGLSSYNVEDPAEVLRLRGALELIIFELKALYQTLCRRAEEHRYSYLIAETHGQWAKPSTFGHLLKVCADTISRCIKRHERDLDYELMEANIPGAVGNFIGIDPRTAKKAAEILRLKLAPAETQILQRDRHAAVLAHLAITARVIENISETLWLMARSIEGTIAEPFGAKQKGSSAMPHKKNPITIERMKGLARLVSADALVGFEDIVTRGWRSIEQSSAERHIFVRATTLVHYMARKMTWIISEALVAAGVEPDLAYRYTQRLGHIATQKGNQDFRTLLSTDGLDDTDPRTAETILGAEMLNSFFDLERVVNPGINYIFSDH